MVSFFQVPVPQLPPHTDLSGQTVIVTGAARGLGYEAARQFLDLKVSTIVLTVRSLKDGEAARTRLQQDPSIKNKNPTAKILVYELDLATYTSIKSFAEKVLRDLLECHIVLLNGGLNLMSWTTAPTGYETTIQVNYIADAFLAFLLLPLLLSTSAKSRRPPTITVVGSQMQKFPSLTKGRPIEGRVLDHVSDPKKYAPFSRYGDSKLMIALFIRELAARVPRTQVLVNNVCPGLVNSTNLERDLPSIVQYIGRGLRKIRGRKIEDGTRILVYASAIAGAESHGELVSDWRVNQEIAELHKKPEVDEISKKLWNETYEELVKIAPEITHLVKN